MEYLLHVLEVHSVACDETYHEYGRYPPLSLVLTTAVVELMKLGKKVLVVPQPDEAVNKKVGSQPRSDYGIFLKVGIDRQPLMIIEYKQQTDTDVGSVSCADMVELFLHGYYILKKQQLSSILLCLTSLSVWHVFYVSMLPSAVHLVMSVNWHFKHDNNTWPGNEELML